MSSDVETETIFLLPTHFNANASPQAEQRHIHVDIHVDIHVYIYVDIHVDIHVDNIFS